MKQVQIASDAAKGGAARLADGAPAFEDNEATFADLVARLRKTVAYLRTIKAEQVDGSEDRTVTWKTRTATKSMQGMPYLLNHVLPNLYFHIATAYAILRHNGVEIGRATISGDRDVERGAATRGRFASAVAGAEGIEIKATIPDRQIGEALKASA